MLGSFLPRSADGRKGSIQGRRAPPLSVFPSLGQKALSIESLAYPMSGISSKTSPDSIWRLSMTETVGSRPP